MFYKSGCCVIERSIQTAGSKNRMCLSIFVFSLSLVFVPLNDTVLTIELHTKEIHEPQFSHSHIMNLCFIFASVCWGYDRSVHIHAHIRTYMKNEIGKHKMCEQSVWTMRPGPCIWYINNTMIYAYVAHMNRFDNGITLWLLRKRNSSFTYIEKKIWLNAFWGNRQLPPKNVHRSAYCSSLYSHFSMEILKLEIHKGIFNN